MWGGVALWQVYSFAVFKPVDDLGNNRLPPHLRSAGRHHAAHEAPAHMRVSNMHVLVWFVTLYT